MLSSVALLLLPTSAFAALANCPCLTSFPFGINPANGITIGGQQYTGYAADYGLNTCYRHDLGKQPWCATTTNRPAWCLNAWCYVDRYNCNMPTAISTYFPSGNLYYSYRTCGSANTFSNWFGSGGGTASATSNGGDGQTHTIGELVDVVHDYLISNTNTLEAVEPEIRNANSCGSSPMSSCPCTTCNATSPESLFWSNNSGTTAFDFSTITLTAHPDSSQAPPAVEGCLSSFLENSFMRVAAREANIGSRIGYEYAAFQAGGSYVQWPAQQWCPGTSGNSVYDPRFRSWYVAAASGPKDVVIVIDVSGSMGVSGRMGIARTAAKKVLDTLTESDYVGRVAFAAQANTALGASRLLRATAANIASLKAWVDTLAPTSTTNFVAAFNSAKGLITASIGDGGATSSCTRAILFLSDGDPNSWEDSDYATLRSDTASNSIKVFTYALGSGANPTILKRIACQNNGGFWQVPDGGDLGAAMSDYFKFLAPMQAPCQVRWTSYVGISTGTPLLAACIPAFQKATAGASTSCAGGTTGCMNALIGVMCMDVSMIVPVETLEARSDYAAFNSRVIADQTACTQVTPTSAQLQYLRSTIPSQFGNAVCSAEDLNADVPQTSCDTAGTTYGVYGEGSDGGGSGGGGDTSSAGSMGAILGGAGAGVVVLIILCYCGAKMAAPKKAKGVDEGQNRGSRPQETEMNVNVTVQAQPSVPMGMGQPVMAQPVMQAQSLYPSPPMGQPVGGPQVMTLTATVPGGNTMQYQGANGMTMNVQVPPGVQVGQQFQFQG
mgnify:CR=1 FL=1